MKGYADLHPVDSVTWQDAQAVIKKLNAMEKTTVYRLPSKAEWEYAARAVATEESPGRELSQSPCQNDTNKGTIHAVGQKKSNSWDSTTCRATFGSGSRTITKNNVCLAQCMSRSVDSTPCGWIPSRATEQGERVVARFEGIDRKSGCRQPFHCFGFSKIIRPPGEMPFQTNNWSKND